MHALKELFTIPIHIPEQPNLHTFLNYKVPDNCPRGVEPWFLADRPQKTVLLGKRTLTAYTIESNEVSYVHVLESLGPQVIFPNAEGLAIAMPYLVKPLMDIYHKERIVQKKIIMGFDIKSMLKHSSNRYLIPISWLGPRKTFCFGAEAINDMPMHAAGNIVICFD